MVPPIVGSGTFFVGSFVRLFLGQYATGIVAARITMWSIFFVALHSSVTSFAVALDLIPALLRVYVMLIPIAAVSEYVILRNGLGLEGAAWCTLAILAVAGAAEVALAKRKCGDTSPKIFLFIASLYFPTVCAMCLKQWVDGIPVDVWLTSHSGTIIAPAMKAAVFLLLYTPILLAYETKFSLVRRVSQGT
jgi:hypothetical protein